MHRSLLLVAAVLSGIGSSIPQPPARESAEASIGEPTLRLSLPMDSDEPHTPSFSTNAARFGEAVVKAAKPNDGRKHPNLPPLQPFPLAHTTNTADGPPPKPTTSPTPLPPETTFQTSPPPVTTQEQSTTPAAAQPTFPLGPLPVEESKKHTTTPLPPESTFSMSPPPVFETTHIPMDRKRTTTPLPPDSTFSMSPPPVVTQEPSTTPAVAEPTFPLGPLPVEESKKHTTTPLPPESTFSMSPPPVFETTHIPKPRKHRVHLHHGMVPDDRVEG